MLQLEEGTFSCNTALSQNLRMPGTMVSPGDTAVFQSKALKSGLFWEEAKP